MARSASQAPPSTLRVGQARRVARVLVLFATREGHSAKVAAAVGDTLRGEGLRAEVVDVAGTGPDAGAYDAAVIVASVHRGEYRTAVRDWARHHARALNAMPTAFVSVSLGVLQTDPKVRQESDEIRARFLEKTGWQPAALLHAAGALMYSRYNFIERMLMKRIAAQAGGDTDTSRDYEYTDWAALRTFVREFAAGIGSERGPGTVQPGSATPRRPRRA
jgi:menaquinone-dependent protoporphyrinogen oxidase